MLPLCLLLASHAAATKSIAYIAQYYAPPASKAKSSFHVYLADQTGAHRKQLTKMTGQLSDVRWMGAGHLVFIRTIGKMHELWSMDTSGKHLKKLYSNAAITVAANRPLEDQPGAPTYNIGGKDMHFAGSKWVQVEFPVSDGERPDTGPWNIQTNDHSRPFTIQTDALKIMDGPPATMVCKVGGKEFTTACYGTPTKIVYSKDPSVGYIAFFNHNSTNGTSWVITRVNLNSGAAARQAEGFGDLDFWPGSALFAGVTPRDLISYGKKTVWGNAIKVGKPGLTPATAVKGLVFCQSVALQP